MIGQPITIRINPELLKRLDSYKKRYFWNRSNLINHIVAIFLDEAEAKDSALE